ncbi:MAG: ZIP family metal transporter [Patescibacteria group bacterium]
MILLQIILATLFVSAISIFAVLIFFKKQGHITFKPIISFAAGVLLAFAWLDVIPEAVDGLKLSDINLVILVTIIILFIVESFFHWHHCQHEDCKSNSHKHLILFNLFGDGLHNFVDGVLIASTFMVDVRLGILTTLAVILHEIPQELADVGILIYAGLGRSKVLIYNFISALTAVLGALLAYFFAVKFSQVLPYFLAVVAGNFIYLALSDLVPIIHHEEKSRVLKQVAWFLLGAIFIYLFGCIEI